MRHAQPAAGRSTFVAVGACKVVFDITKNVMSEYSEGSTVTKYYAVEREGRRSLVIAAGGEYYDTASLDETPESYVDLVRTARIAGVSVEDLTGRIVEAAKRIDPDHIRADLALPVEMDEVWAAGVTYRISTDSREGEGSVSKTYLDAYESERPEIYFKATPSRTVGPGEAVGIRGDSTWDTPEPELAVVLYQGSIVGYTIGNDMSSRSIEGENPLYLPQAKVYDRCCSLGPCVVSAADIEDPHDLEMTMQIHRDGEVVYVGVTNTKEMVRTCEELTSYLTRHNVLPDLTVLLTGTALVPNGDFTLQEGDEVEIEIEGFGTLRNPVTAV
jgi:2-dehydro-3-deoxy-D-arabinonate dehydratase